MIDSLAHVLTSALKALIIAEVLRRSLESANYFVDRDHSGQMTLTIFDA